ncbi:MAG: SMC-Scp complex subunit ScpB [Gammaproteobacteria bacterium]|nr:SMC-Scp complex subunit ScpB [Gammaproteobacteria bacterium]MBQ0839883.1 SMC-Scp complex subunit ScpB [Gammaproteobacteria bacterium]
MDAEQLRRIVEAALLAAGDSMDIPALQKLFDEEWVPERDEFKAALEDIEADCRDRGYELKRTASGYRFQVKEQYAQWIGKLWEEKPKKYSRATLETLALIAYRQPLTRGDIEQVRGVAVSSDIIRTLHDRGWIRSVGHRDVPGRPALYATTRQFLDNFNLQSLEQLPPLSEIRELSSIDRELQFEEALAEGKAEKQSGDAEKHSEDSEEDRGDAAETDDADRLDSDTEQAATEDSAVGERVDNFTERDSALAVQPQTLVNENTESTAIDNEESPES